MNTSTKTIAEIIAFRKLDPLYGENMKRINELTSDPKKIPTLNEVREIQRLEQNEYISTDIGILAGINLIKSFPFYHEFLINFHGLNKTLDFTLPFSFFSSLSSYIKVLMENNNLEEVSDILNYLEVIVHNDDELLSYVGEVLELFDNFPIEMRKKVYNLLPKGLKLIFDQYYSHYLI